jgi:hypothetical protein
VYHEWELLKQQQPVNGQQQQAGQQQVGQLQAAVTSLTAEREQILKNWSEETGGLVSIYHEDKAKWEAALQQQREEYNDIAALLEGERYSRSPGPAAGMAGMPGGGMGGGGIAGGGMGGGMVAGGMVAGGAGLVGYGTSR